MATKHLPKNLAGVHEVMNVHLIIYLFEFCTSADFMRVELRNCSYCLKSAQACMHTSIISITPAFCKEQRINLSIIVTNVDKTIHLVVNKRPP